MVLCHYLNEEYKKKLLGLVSFINDHVNKLSRPLTDLDDVRLAMEALSTIQEKRSDIDISMGPIEVRWLLICYIVKMLLFLIMCIISVSR